MRQERLLDYAALLDPKSRPTAGKKLVPDVVQYTPRLNPKPDDWDPLAPPEHQPPVPEYKVRLRPKPCLGAASPEPMWAWSPLACRPGGSAKSWALHWLRSGDAGLQPFVDRDTGLRPFMDLLSAWSDQEGRRAAGTDWGTD